MNSELVTNGEVPTVGRPGPDFNRGEGRAYYNYEQRLDSLDILRTLFHEFQTEAVERGRRRTVFRARCSREVFTQAMAIPRDSSEALPIEAALPLVSLDPNQTDVILMLGKNVHPSLETVPEWNDVYQYWQQPNGRGITPPQRVQNIDHERYQLIDQPRPEHLADLTDIWSVFGWDEAGVASFIANVASRDQQWFAGYTERATGRLVSACMGDSLEIANQLVVEGTEYGTLLGYEKQGLCTAAVVALHAQILRDTLYKTGQAPLILAEFNMTSRSDVVGRHAGMTIPLVEQLPHLENIPFQVLRRNVSVLDHHPQNDIRWRDLNDYELKFRAAYRGSKYRYWRNFIVGMLPRQSIEAHYSPEQVATTLATIES